MAVAYPVIDLVPPVISSATIKEKIICIRAHRERIFRVEHQQAFGKDIFHNYGQAGAGWTFLFGCVNESIRQFNRARINQGAQAKNSIAVIGAGCYGLLTAIHLARAGHNVSIIAVSFQDSASDKAAGFFFPRPRRTSTPAEKEIFFTTGIESYREYLSIAQGKHPFIARGPQILPAYYGLDIDPGFEPYYEHSLVARPRRVQIDFGAGSRHDVMEYHLVYINPSEIMQQLREQVRLLGIPLINRSIESFDQLEHDIIFNCAGLGAKKLTGDKALIPVQGHLITLCNQSNKQNLQYMINVKVPGVNERGIPRNDLIYFAPKDEGILGITFLRGTDSLTSNQHEFERLITRCREFFAN